MRIERMLATNTSMSSPRSRMRRAASSAKVLTTMNAPAEAARPIGANTPASSPPKP